MMIRRMACLAGLICALAYCGWATTLNCSGSQSDCQSKVNSASDGDTVNIPAGTFTWNSCLSWSNKNVTVAGAGAGSTIINGPSGGCTFQVTDDAKQTFRITGMTLQGGSQNTTLEIHSENNPSSVYGWRIDHIDFNHPGSTGVYVVGINWGLVDHCTFEGNMNGVVTYSYVNADFPDSNHPGPNGIGAAAWGLPLHLGTNEAVYVEDSTYTGTGGGLGVNDMEYGGRMVFRHNTVSGGTYFQSHSARDSNRGGSLKFEVYNNTFTGNGFFRGFLILSGTGVVFNNTISGYGDSPANSIWFGDQRASQQVVGSQYFACDGSHPWDGNVESSGWPCMDQIGRGPGALGREPTVPVYLWNNGTTPTCATGGACNNTSVVQLNSDPVSLLRYILSAHSNGDKDYCIGGSTMPASCGNHTNAYTPYTYPHPLATGASGTPAPPTGLQATVS